MKPLVFILLVALQATLVPARWQALAAPRPQQASQQIQLLLNTNNAAATLLSRQLLARARQPAELAESYWLLGSALRDQGRFDSSLYYGQRALALATKEGHR